MAVVEARPALGSTTSKPSVFDRGNLTVSCIKVETSKAANSPPKPLFIVTPTLGGTYPVLLFLHGFALKNTCYSQLLQHISSHGYIVVAPQMCVLSTAQQEVDSAAKVTDWLSKGLQKELQNNEIIPNLQQLVLAGHSKGGKIAFALCIQTTLNFSALIGIDPVAGSNTYCESKPKIITSGPDTFEINIPVSVIGTGLGDEIKIIEGKFKPCAPNGMNYKEFFKKCKPPCWCFVAKDYGHMDMLDDGVPSCPCVSGDGPRSSMRRCVGGLVVAFLEACLESENKDLCDIVNHPSIAPIVLDPVICKKN